MKNGCVEIKAFFEWRKATKPQAYEFCISFMKGMMTKNNRQEKIDSINKYHLRGITFEELEREVKSGEFIF